MVFNPDYDLSRPLASALKAKAPYVGIPIPGHAPLIFNRLLLYRAMKGVRVVNVEVLAGLIDDDGRYLVVDGIAEEKWRERSGLGHISRVKHHMKLRAIPRNHFRIAGYGPANWSPSPCSLVPII